VLATALIHGAEAQAEDCAGLPALRIDAAAITPPTGGAG
jgi:hypothetical protein